MYKSLKEYIIALGYWWLIVIAPIILDIIGVYQIASGNQLIRIPSWIWFQVAFIFLLIIPFIAFHKVRVDRDKAIEVEKSIILTPHTYSIGLSGMTGYPKEPKSVYWLCLEVAVNPITKPIDTLDLIIDGENIPVNNWPGKNVTAFNAYFNVTKWYFQGEHKVELIASISDKKYSSGRISIDFNAELFGSHRI